MGLPTYSSLLSHTTSSSLVSRPRSSYNFLISCFALLYTSMYFSLSSFNFLFLLPIHFLLPTFSYLSSCYTIKIENILQVLSGGLKSDEWINVLENLLLAVFFKLTYSVDRVRHERTTCFDNILIVTNL